MPLPLPLILAGAGAALGIGGTIAEFFGAKSRARELKKQIESIIGGLERGLDLEGLQKAYEQAGEQLLSAFSAGASDLRRKAGALGEEYLTGLIGDITGMRQRIQGLAGEARQRVMDVMAGVGEATQRAYQTAIEQQKQITSAEISRQLDVLGAGGLGGARALISARMMAEATQPLVTEKARATERLETLKGKTLAGLESDILGLLSGVETLGFQTLAGARGTIFGKQLGIEEAIFGAGLEAQRRALEWGLQGEREKRGWQAQLAQMRLSSLVTEPSWLELVGGILGGAGRGLMGAGMMLGGGGGGGR